LVDESPDQETTLAASEEFDNRRKTLSDALTVLNERERRIFEARRLAEDPITLADLAEEFGVSRERVRQIEVRAFEKVQKAVKNRIAAMESRRPCRFISFQPFPVVGETADGRVAIGTFYGSRTMREGAPLAGC
ncbi:MAG: sigma-70 family RNA polymerase sigma factor, partial [Pseudolabrys sp.]